MNDMSSPVSDHDQPIDPLVELMGFRLSTATVFFHSAIADRLGMNVTDLKSYSLLRQVGPLTAGELGEQLGLTTGAITGVIDRLEQARLIQRIRDAKDRRRVVLAIVENEALERTLAALYQPLGQAVMALVNKYSAAEQAIIGDFLNNVVAVMEQETTRLRRG